MSRIILYMKNDIHVFGFDKGLIWWILHFRTQICCGIVFKGANGELLVDTDLLRRCKRCKPSQSQAQSEASSTRHTPEMEEPEPLPLTAPATPQDDMDSQIPFPDPPILDRALPHDMLHPQISTESAQQMQQPQLFADSVLDLSMPTPRKNNTDLVPQCIAMEVWSDRMRQHWFYLFNVN